MRSQPAGQTRARPASRRLTTASEADHNLVGSHPAQVVPNDGLDDRPVVAEALDAGGEGIVLLLKLGVVRTDLFELLTELVMATQSVWVHGRGAQGGDDDGSGDADERLEGHGRKTTPPVDPRQIIERRKPRQCD